MKKTLKWKNGMIVRGKFSLDSAKYYIAAAIIMFHIIPLFFVFMGDNGQTILMTVFMLTLNPIFVFGVGCFYAVRNGFDFKFPILLAVISAVSIIMYYSYENAAYMLRGFIITGLVYLIFSYLSSLLGGFIKKFIG